MSGKIGEKDREFVRCELIFIAERLQKRYCMRPKEINRFLHEMLDVSI
jgi:hypothetical protein